ncbi:hypothetical protein F5Y09DRAFT_321120 [Xylaria sp. FL1042]|nr:hypothetical protein F5Y09DRAFT_321120 [Xylaria sp. FL1042]
MSRKPGFDQSFGEALQPNMTIKVDSYDSGATNQQQNNLEEKLHAAENETRKLRDGMEAMASDLLEARNEAKKAHESKEQLELRCTKLGQEVQVLRTTLESERQSQAELLRAQASAPTLEQQSQKQLLVNNKRASEEMQFGNFQETMELQAADIGKLQKLVRFYKRNSERLSAEIQQFKEQSKQR